MKKLIFLFILICTLYMPIYATLKNDIVLVPKTSVVPVIDGVMDGVWHNTTEMILTINEETVNETVQDDWFDLFGSWRMLWDDENIYLFCYYQDDVVIDQHENWYEQDGFEFHFDADNSKTVDSFDGINDIQIRFNHWYESWNDVTFYFGAGNWWDFTAEGIEFKVLDNGDGLGWNLEVKIPAANILMNPEVGHQFGFDVTMNDNDSGNKDHALKWWSKESYYWENPSIWGTCMLTDLTIDEKLPVIKSDLAPTVDGTMDELWLNLPEFSCNKWVFINPFNQHDWTDHRFTFRIMTDDSKIYGFLTMLDDVLVTEHTNDYEKDGVEWFFDANNSKTNGGYDGIDDILIRTNYNGYVSCVFGSENAYWGFTEEMVDLAVSETGEGYNLEWAINAADLKLNLNDESLFGLDVHSNDNDSQYRESVRSWWTDSNDAWMDASILGTAIIVDAEKQGSNFVPPDILHTAVETANAGEDITITADVQDQSGLRSVNLYHRKGGAQTYEKTAMTYKEGSTYEAKISSDYLPERGIEYYITAEDSYDYMSTLPSSRPMNNPYFIGMIILNLGCPNSTPGGRYRMVSVPLSLNIKTPGDVWQDDLGDYHKNVWRLFRYQGNGYVEYQGGNLDNIEPGRSYWLITKGSKGWDTGSGQSVSTSSPIKITLQPGWNMIGCPFAFSVLWSSVALGGKDIGNPVGYSGDVNEKEGYDYNQTVLEPWKGYLVKNNESVSVEIEIPATAYETPTTKLSEEEVVLREEEWEVEVVVESEQYRDSGNRFGVFSDSDEGWDIHDYPEVPPFGEYVRMVFPHPEWQSRAGDYSGDFRSQGKEDHEWQVVTGTRGVEGEITMAFRGIETIPENRVCYLVDEVLKKVIDLKEERTYSYAIVGYQTERTFRIMVGSQETMEEEIDQVPETFMLYPNFPNPFNSSTIIRYALPEASRVTMRVVNVLGREVMVLIDDDTREAGIHEVLWDGKNGSGQAVGSGIYVVMLRSDSGTIKRKVVFVE